jgi:hypothetical protein
VLCIILVVAKSSSLQAFFDSRRVRPEAVYKAACTMAGDRPNQGVLLRFGGFNESEIERWEGGRWRVTSYMLHEDKAGLPAKTIFQCVLRYRDSKWEMEDLRLEAHQ